MSSDGSDFAGRRVLITGASSGIGRATAIDFCAAGAHVIGAGRRQNALEGLRDEISASSGTIEVIAGDVNIPAFVDSLARHAGAVDILVNCAGFARHSPFLDGDPADWRAIFETNVVAVMTVTQAVVRGMKPRGSGHIFNISSILADRVYPFTMAYAASKHAVRAVCRGLRVELAPHGIKVTEVAPGLVETAILSNTDHEEVLEAYSSRPYPPLVPEDIAHAITAAAASGPNACPELIAINPMGQV